MSDESSTETQECILKCPEAKIFFPFPNKLVMRNMWYYKLGLDEGDFYPFEAVCDRHFSKKMFTGYGKLKAIAVPDINIPNNPASKDTPPGPQITMKQTKCLKKQKPIKKIEFPNVQSAVAPINSNSNNVPTTNTQIGGNPSSTQNWINDNSEILVDYQLKVGGKHVCDVIEIPQYIVVFTVIKAKQHNKIVLADLKNSNNNPTTNNSNIKNKAVTTKKPASKVLPKPSAFITIDDDGCNDGGDDDVAEVGSKSATVQTKSLEIVPLTVPSVQTVLTVLPNKPFGILPTRLPVLEDKHQKIVEPELADLQADLLEILGPENSEVILPNSNPTIVKPKSKKKPEIDVVFYTTDDVPPRRDRACQVDFSRKRVATGIQCDFQFDIDSRSLSQKSKNNGMEAINPPSEDIDECLLCGEILSDSASKVKHALSHEPSPSLCSQCGAIFESPNELLLHESMYHLCGLNLGKPQRCPKTKCNKAFRSMKQLNRHIEEHVRTRQHKCNKCLEYFGSAMKLICHQRALDKCLRTRGWTSRRWSKRM